MYYLILLPFILFGCLPDIEVNVPTQFQCSIDGFMYNMAGEPIIDDLGAQMTCVTGK